MRRPLSLFITISALCLQQIHAEPSLGRSVTQQQSSSTFDSINNFQSIFKSSIQAAADSLQSQPDDQTSILKDLNSEISNATQTLVYSLMEEFDQFDVTETAALVGLSVENALTQLQQSPDYLFDIDTIVIQFQQDMEDILKFALKNNSKNSNSNSENQNSEQLVQMVQNSVDNLFDVDFFWSFKETSDDLYDDKFLKSPQNQRVGSQQIVQLLKLDDSEGAKKMFERVLIESSQSEVIDAILESLKDTKLSENLIKTMVLIYSDVEFPIQPFSIALGVAYKNFQQQLSELIGKVIVELKQSSSDEGMAEALAFALAQKGDTSKMYTSALKFAVKEGGCTMVAQLLIEAEDKAIENGVIKQFENSIEQDEKLTECKKVGEELSVTVDILKVLDEPQKAFKLMQKAIEQKQDAAIATSIIEGIEQGKEAEVITLLNQLLTNSDIPTEQLALQLSLSLTSGDEKVLNVILNTAKQLNETELEPLADAFIFALLSGQQGMESIFVNFLKQSVQDKECQLKQLMTIVQKEASEQQYQQILKILSDHPSIQPCINQSLTSDQQPLSVSLPTTHSKQTAYNAPSPTLPSAVPEKLPISPLSIGPSAEIVLQFTSILSDLNNQTTQDEVTNIQTNSGVPLIENYNNDIILSPSPSPSKQTPSPPKQVPQEKQGGSSTCDDIAPPGSFTCKEQAKFGKCVRMWMKTGGFCRKTCGECSTETVSSSLPQEYATITQSTPTPTPTATPTPASTPTPTPISTPTPAAFTPAPISPPLQSIIDPDSNKEGAKCMVDEDLLLRVAKLAVEEYLKNKDKIQAI